jgi:hypothetical protein
MSLNLKQLLAKRIDALRLVNQAATLLKPQIQKEQEDERKRNNTSVKPVNTNVNP